MPISASERRFIDEVSLALPWGLVEQFSTTPRWRPEDVNRGADMLIAKLRGVGVPVEVHEPEICLSVPLSASVTAGGVTTGRSRLRRRCACRTDAAAGWWRCRPIRVRCAATIATSPRCSAAASSRWRR